MAERKDGKKKKQPRWYFDALVNAKTTEERRTLRSKTFPGMAEQMAKQWSDLTDFYNQIKLDI